MSYTPRGKVDWNNIDPDMLEEAKAEGLSIEDYLEDYAYKCEWSGDYFYFREGVSDTYDVELSKDLIYVHEDYAGAYNAEVDYDPIAEHGTHNFAHSGNAYGGFSR